MAFQDLGSFLEALESRGELVRVKEELSPEYEVAAAIAEFAQARKGAVLFEKVTGHRVPIVGNLLGSVKRLALAFGVAEADLPQAAVNARRHRIKPRIVSSGPVQEVVVRDGVNIGRDIPVLTHFARDIGPYFSTAFTVAKDPETGIRAMGIHRVQIKGTETIGVFFGNPPLSHVLAKAEKQGKPLEVAMVLGADPLTWLASIAFEPQGIDKYDIAGGFLGKPLELVKCISVDLEVPAHAQFVLEGHIIPYLREEEGPFGESNGYYCTFQNPVGRIRAITHRHNPIYHALVPFMGEERNLGAVLASDFLPALRAQLPQIRKIAPRGFLGATVVQIEKLSDDDPKKVIETLIQQTGIKAVIVVDQDVNVEHPEEVDWAVTSRVRFDRDVSIFPDMPGGMLDPSGEKPERAPGLETYILRVSKMGIDATKPLDELERYEKVDMPLQCKEKVATLLKKYLR